MKICPTIEEAAQLREELVRKSASPICRKKNTIAGAMKHIP
jgi:hypothetical protein